MALVAAMSEVIGVLAAMALLLWFAAYMEARHLGPVDGRAMAEQAHEVPAGPGLKGALDLSVETPLLLNTDSLSSVA